MNNLAVIILNYNSWQDTINEIEMVHKVLEIEYKDFIIVDNCSKNDSYKKLCEFAKGRFEVILSKSNEGYAAGNNIGLKFAKENGYKYGWVLNNDIIIEDKDLINKMCSVFIRDSKIATVNPDVYSPEGHMFNRDSVRPNFFDFTIGMKSYSKKGRKIKDEGGYAYVYRPQGCCMLLNLEKMENVEYLDEGTFLYSEEIILAERLLQKGYRCACCVETKIIHNHSKTVKSNINAKKVRKIQRESFRYYLSKYRKYNPLAILISDMFYELKLRLLER